MILSSGGTVQVRSSRQVETPPHCLSTTRRARHATAIRLRSPAPRTCALANRLAQSLAGNCRVEPCRGCPVCANRHDRQVLHCCHLFVTRPYLFGTSLSALRNRVAISDQHAVDIRTSVGIDVSDLQKQGHRGYDSCQVFLVKTAQKTLPCKWGAQADEIADLPIRPCV